MEEDRTARRRSEGKIKLRSRRYRQGKCVSAACGSGGSRLRLAGQLRANQRLDLIPDGGITIDFHVRLHEKAVVPGVLKAGKRVLFVVEAEIAENCSPRGIGSANL